MTDEEIVEYCLSKYLDSHNNYGLRDALKEAISLSKRSNFRSIV